jgi:hypothetical protein
MGVPLGQKVWGFSRERNARWGWQVEVIDTSQKCLLLHMLMHAIGWLRRQRAGHMQLVILICLAIVTSHFPTASTETPRVGGTGTRSLWNYESHRIIIKTTVGK